MYPKLLNKDWSKRKLAPLTTPVRKYGKINLTELKVISGHLDVSYMK